MCDWRFDKNYGNRVAVSVQMQSGTIKDITYDNLDNEVGQLQRHIQKNRLFLNLAANNIESVVGYLACIFSGTTVMMSRANIAENAFQTILQEFKPDYIWIQKNAFVSQDYFAIYEKDSYRLYEARRKSVICINYDIAVLLPTSGTTGGLKYVKLTRENLRDNAEAIIEGLNITKDDVTITSLPIYYTYGLSLINTYLLCGARIVLTNLSYLQKEFWELFRRTQVTSVSGVPFFYEVLFRMNIDKMVLASLRVMTQAGGRLLPELQQYFGEYAKKHNIRFYIMYGQTEATARITILPAHRVLDKIGSVGLPIRGGQVLIANQNESGIGEVVYKGNNIFKGYAFKREELTTLQESTCLNTGDIGYMDADGYLYLCGRVDRIVKLAGNRIDLNDIENLIFKKFGLMCKALLRDKNVLLLMEIYKDGITAYLHAVTGLNKQYFKIKQVQQLPRNEYGKYMEITDEEKRS